jgi:predicted LPLAT superfamily acyltransferase
VFELLDTSQGVDVAMRHYVARLEHFCRDAPYNWFNFYDFWA